MITFDELEELRKLVWQTHVDKGFAAINDQETPERFFMQVVGELSEAYEEYRKGDIKPYIDDKGKPQGEMVELADAVIRMLNRITYIHIARLGLLNEEEKKELYKRIKIEYDECVDLGAISFTKEDVYSALIEGLSKRKEEYFGAIKVIDIYIESAGYNLKDLIILKNDYNMTRPHLHGKNF